MYQGKRQHPRQLMIHVEGLSGCEAYKLYLFLLTLQEKELLGWGLICLVNFFPNSIKSRQHPRHATGSCEQGIFQCNLQPSKLIQVVKGVIYDSGESLLMFDLNSQTNTPLPSALLHTRTCNAQHLFILCTTTNCDIPNILWKRGSNVSIPVLDDLGWWLHPSPLFVSCLQSQDCVKFLFFSPHTESQRTVRRPLLQL